MAVLMLSTGFLFAQDKAQKIKDLLNKYYEYEQFNGSVLVADDGKIILSDGFGMANMEFEIPNRPHTKHRLGSITKQFTAALIMQLVEEGKLELDEPISKYLPEYIGPAADVVTFTTYSLIAQEFRATLPSQAFFRKKVGILPARRILLKPLPIPPFNLLQERDFLIVIPDISY